VPTVKKNFEIDKTLHFERLAPKTRSKNKTSADWRVLSDFWRRPSDFGHPPDENQASSRHVPKIHSKKTKKRRTAHAVRFRTAATDFGHFL